MSTRSQLEKLINRERLLQEFKNLVAIDSESYQERAIADYLIKRLKELGLNPVEDEAGELLREKSGIQDGEVAGNIFARLLPLNEEEKNLGSAILFSSHMDTVAPGKNKKVVVHEDGRITSDGSTVLGADDLAGIAAILEMLWVIKENNLEHPEIEVLFPVAEEPYAQGSRVFDYSQLHSKEAYVLDLSGKVGAAAVAAPSMISFKVTVKGLSAHAGFAPENGIHAIKIAAKAISEIPNGHVEDDTTLNFGLISGGTARNIIPDEVVIQGEIRSMDHQKALGWIEKIRVVFENAANEYYEEFQKNSKVHETIKEFVSVDYIEEFKAYRIGENENVRLRFQKSCEELDIPYKFIDTFGGSDNNHFTANGIRGIVTACAMNNVHTKQEYTTVEELVNSALLTLRIATIDEV